MTQITANQSRSDLCASRQLRVVVYAHVNGRDSERLRSLAAQVEILRRHGRRAEWTIVEELADAGSGADRPDLSRVLSDAQDGLYDVLLVYAFDRLARSVRDAAFVFDELDRAGVLVLSVTDVLDITSLDRQTCLLIRSAIAASQDNQARASAGRCTHPDPGEKL